MSLRAAVLLAVVLIVPAGIVGLREAFEDRPDVLRDDRESVLVVELAGNGRQPTARDAMHLWIECSRSLAPAQQQVAPVVSDERMTVRVRPALGEHQSRRVRGCLQDLTIEKIAATVRSIEERPAARFRSG